MLWFIKEDMKRSIQFVVSAFLLLAVGFAAGAVTAGVKQWFLPLATINIENQSGQALRYLEVRFKNSVSDATWQLKPLAVGERAVARIHIPGEGGYTVRAVLADGSVVKESQGYVHAGYQINEVVGKEEIRGDVVRLY